MKNTEKLLEFWREEEQTGNMASSIDKLIYNQLINFMNDYDVSRRIFIHPEQWEELKIRKEMDEHVRALYEKY